MGSKKSTSVEQKGKPIKKERKRSLSSTKEKDSSAPPPSFPEKKKKKLESVFPVVRPAPSSSLSLSSSSYNSSYNNNNNNNNNNTNSNHPKKKWEKNGGPADEFSSKPDSISLKRRQDHGDGPPEACSARRGEEHSSTEGNISRGFIAPFIPLKSNNNSNHHTHYSKKNKWNAPSNVVEDAGVSRGYAPVGGEGRGRGRGRGNTGFIRGRGSSPPSHPNHTHNSSSSSSPAKGMDGTHDLHRSRSGGRGNRNGSRGRRGCGVEEEQHEEEEAEEGKKGALPSRLAVHTHVITTQNDRNSEIPVKLNTKVFVDGLPYYEEPAEPGKPTLEEELLQFAVTWRVGKPLRLLKKNGQGFGFLVFKSPHSVDTAVRVLNGRTFLGRVLRVERPKEKHGMMRGEGGDSAISPSEMSSAEIASYYASPYQKTLQNAQCTYPRQVLLTDLPKGTAPDMLREVIRDLSPLLEQKIAAIKMTSNNRKAFLTCDTEEDAGVAVKFLDGMKLLGRTVAALRAAAPGTLPYSPVHHKATPLPPLLARTGEVGEKRGREEGDGNEDGERNRRKICTAGGEGREGEEEEEETMVPLGLAVPPRAENHHRSTTKKMRKATLQVVEKDANALHSNDTSVALAKNSSLSTPLSGRANHTGRTKKYNLLDDGPTEVYVGNLGEDVTEAQVRHHFASCGNIRSCELVVNPHTFAFTGIAKVNFSLPAYAAYAQQQLNGSRLGGNTIQVDRS